MATATYVCSIAHVANLLNEDRELLEAIVIPCLRQNPKFFVSDDPEAI